MVQGRGTGRLWTRHHNRFLVLYWRRFGSNDVTQNVELETTFPPETHVGHYVTVGANCVLKSCRIDDLVRIGDKCTVLEGAMVENHVVLEPGTVVLPYQRVVSGQKWGGNPARYVADLTPEELESFKTDALAVHDMAKEHLVEFLPYGYSYVHLEDLAKQVDEVNSEQVNVVKDSASL